MSTSCTTCSTRVSDFGCDAGSKRIGIGSASTYARAGTRGMTCSTMFAAAYVMRRASHDEYNSRRLQMKATSLS